MNDDGIQRRLTVGRTVRLRRVRNCLLAAIPLACLLLLGGEVRGQERDSGRAATAEALFREGKTLMDDGFYEQACPKLEASQRIDPAVGTLLNLAICYEKTGKTASAWVEYLRAASMAKTRGQIEREQFARDHAAALEPRLIRVAFAVDEGALVEGLVVRRDNIGQESATWASPAPVDPGTLQITVSAPGKKEWQTRVEVATEGKIYTIDIPALEDAEEEPPVPVPVPKTVEPVTPFVVDVESIPSGDTQRTVGILVGGVGLAGLAVGTVFGLQARSSWRGVDCPGNVCVTSQDQSRAEKAMQYADISTWSFLGGGALMAVGTVLWLTAPDEVVSREVARHRPMELRVIPTAEERSGGVVILGQF